MTIVVYKERWLINFVCDQVSQTEVTNQDLLEERIHKKLTSYLLKIEGAHKHYKKLRQIVMKEISDAYKRNKLENTTSFSELLAVNDFGESIEYEPEDLLAQGGETVIENISLKEKIARLATDDRERITLNAWSKGYNDKEVSETLASHFGGNSESHRKFVQRFKAKCRSKLSA